MCLKNNLRQDELLAKTQIECDLFIQSYSEITALNNSLFAQSKMVALLVKYQGASAVTYAVTMETTWSLIAVKERF